MNKIPLPWLNCSLALLNFQYLFCSPLCCSYSVSECSLAFSSGLYRPPSTPSGDPCLCSSLLSAFPHSFSHSSCSFSDFDLLSSLELSCCGHTLALCSAVGESPPDRELGQFRGSPCERPSLLASWPCTAFCPVPENCCLLCFVHCVCFISLMAGILILVPSLISKQLKTTNYKLLFFKTLHHYWVFL